MEALRRPLLAPSATTVLVIFGCIHAMTEMIGARYAAKDDEGNPLLPHPYAPWEVPKLVAENPKYKAMVDKAYRAFKMCENVKEWTFLSLPCMWIFSFYGGGLPYISDAIMDGLVVSSGVVYLIGNHKFVKGYIQDTKDRLPGFKIRTKVVQFWLFGSALSTVWGGAKCLREK